MPDQLDRFLVDFAILSRRCRPGEVRHEYRKNKVKGPMSQHPNLLKAFATTSPGLERVLADELVQLGAKQVHKGRAGCGFATDRIGLERVTMSLVTAHRVLWTLGEVEAQDADRLYRAVRDLVRWQGIVPADKTFAVFATCRDTPAFRDARFAGLRPARQLGVRRVR